jgi:hypothetical protein
MTQFALKINEDLVDFLYIETDKDGNVVNEQESELFDVLGSNPSVVDMTHLAYIPYLDSEWDGSDFIDSENRDVVDIQESKVQDKKFAFLVDQRYKFFYGVVDSEENAMTIAALSSNPQIVIKG